MASLYTMLSPLHSYFLYQRTHNMLNYYQVRHCIIQLLSAWMSQDMPTPLSCLSFLSVFLSFVSFNNDSFLLEQWFSFSFSFLFCCCVRVSLCPALSSLYFHPRYLISPVCSLLSVYCAIKWGKKIYFKYVVLASLFLLFLIKERNVQKFVKLSDVSAHTKKKTSVLEGVRGFSSQNNWSGRLYSNTVRKYRKGGTICVNHSGS